MKVCIFDTGASGGYMGAKLALAGGNVSLIAREPQLAAIRDKGLTLIEEGADPVTVPVHASPVPAELGPQDYGSSRSRPIPCPPMFLQCDP